MSHQRVTGAVKRTCQICWKYISVPDRSDKPVARCTACGTEYIVKRTPTGRNINLEWKVSK